MRNSGFIMAEDKNSSDIGKNATGGVNSSCSQKRKLEAISDLNNSNEKACKKICTEHFNDVDFSEFFNQDPFTNELEKLCSQEAPKASTTLSTGKIERKQQQIKDLNVLGRHPLITGKVQKISTPKSARCAERNHFFTFILSDQSGEIECIALAPHALPLSEILKVGSSVEIGKGNVRRIERNTIRDCDNDFNMTLDHITSIKIIMENRIIYSHPFSEETLIRSNPSVRRSQSQVLPKLCVRNLNTSHSNSNETIELRVKCLLKISPISTNNYFIRFIGYDDTGEICCSIFEPFAFILEDVIRDGTLLKLKNFVIEPCKGLFHTGCKNLYLLKAFHRTEVKILEDENHLKETSIDLTTLQDLKQRKNFEIVNFLGIFVESELSNCTRHKKKVPCRKLKITDTSGVVAYVVLFEKIAVNFSIPVGTIIEMKKVQIRKDRNDYELYFKTMSSIEILTDEDDNEM